MYTLLRTPVNIRGHTLKGTVMRKALPWLLNVYGGLLLYCLVVQPVPAAEPGSASQMRPRIGLALSGGGARGAAHVGVLRVLEELHIPIDYIAGTSMGSIIGGLYASGMTPDEIDTALQTMDWEHIFSDDPPRKQRSFRRKRDDDLYLVNARPGISEEGELKFPTGAIQGQKFDLALRELTLPVSTVTDFDRLRIPFRAVASDIATGKVVVLGSGDLATSLRASMAVPGAFAAVEIDGVLLVDGGITNNLPIDVVRAMGADIVIAVDISTPYKPAEEVDNLFAIAGQLTSILTRSNADRQITTLTERDVLIVPDLGDITSSDFTRAQEAVSSGRAATLAQRDSLAGLAVPEADYREYRAMLAARPSGAPPVVEFIRIENNSRVSDDMIRARLHQPIGAPLDRARLEQDIGHIYGLELFETVHYDMIEEDGRAGLLVSANARSWGPDYLEFGLDLSNNLEGDNSYNFALSYLRTAINSLNGELRLALQMGESPMIGGEWFQPLDPLSRYFVSTGLKYEATNVDFFDLSAQQRVAEYRVRGAELELAAGREFSVFGEARLGYRYTSGKVKVRTGPAGLPEYSFDTGQLFGRLSVDRLDNYNFPEDGGLASMEYAVAREDFGGNSDFDQLLLRGNTFTTLGNRNVLGLAGAVLSTLEGTAAVQDRFRMGGFLNLSGFPQDSLSGQQAAMLAAIYYRRFSPMPFLSWYIGGSLEYGGVWEDKDDIGSDSIASGSLFLGADTPVGPLYAGYGHAEGGYNAVFFYLGRPPFFQ